MRVVILAAGKGTRLSKMVESTPKPLVPFGDEPLLLRTIRQLHAHNLTKITVVCGHAARDICSALSLFPQVETLYNERYAEDKNIYSTLLALRKSNESTLLLEGDVVFSEAAASCLAVMARSRSSVWAANGLFQPGQMGGIMRIGPNNIMEDLRYVYEYQPRWSRYYKNLGAIFLHKSILPSYRELLEQVVQNSISQYFMDPWLENMPIFPAKVFDVGPFGAASFNTEKEYYAACSKLCCSVSKKRIKKYPIELVEVKNLQHIEEYSRRRVEWLKRKIGKEGVWKQVLCLDEQFDLVMDGQHRMEVAKALGLKRVPAIRFSYDEVEVWSLRPHTHSVTKQEIISRALKGSIYPYKTAKHLFPVAELRCTIPLQELY